MLPPMPKFLNSSIRLPQFDISIMRNRCPHPPQLPPQAGGSEAISPTAYIPSILVIRVLSVLYIPHSHPSSIPSFLNISVLGVIPTAIITESTTCWIVSSPLSRMMALSTFSAADIFNQFGIIQYLYSYRCFQGFGSFCPTARSSLCLWAIVMRSAVSIRERERRLQQSSATY